MAFAVLNEDFFIAMIFTGSWRQHSAALKYVRKVLDLSGDAEIRFSREPEVMKAIIHPPGTGYSFHEKITKLWSWLEMIGQLDEPSRRVVCHGPDGNGGGVAACSISRRPGSYDHSTHDELKRAGAPKTKDKVPVFHFVILRVDGSSIRLHPTLNKCICETFQLAGHDPDVGTPLRGLGNSDGKGTFAIFKKIGTQQDLHFDAQKGNGLWPNKR